MKYYIVSDVHGYLTLLKSALQEAGFFKETEPCKLVVCGDLLDRGGEARELIDLMTMLKNEDKLIYVLGNHEELLVDCLQDISRGGAFEIASGMSHHYTNGTWDTLLQISEMTEQEAYKNYYELIRRVKGSTFYRELLPSCVDHYETENYIFVHGWLPCTTEKVEWNRVKHTYDPEWRTADRDARRRSRWSNGMDMACRENIIEKGKTVVCGHWHASYGHARFEGRGSEWGADADFSPFYAEGIIAIDACTAVSQRVNCIVVEDKEK